MPKNFGRFTVVFWHFLKNDCVLPVIFDLKKPSKTRGFWPFFHREKPVFLNKIDMAICDPHKYFGGHGPGICKPFATRKTHVRSKAKLSN